MIKYKKKQLLNMAGRLIQENEIKRIISEKNVKQVLETLTHCQELAFEMGTDIEQRPEDECGLIKDLEAYCEVIYQQSLVLSDVNQSRVYQKKVRRLLLRIVNKIKYELSEDRLEMAFLPYKVSMWDSLESVWMAAKEDENCDAYVVPIPYFDKNADGSFGQMHYEGDEYPNYVTVTPWQEYNIESRRPDAIFIHNPYDTGNYVTSVHPDYYAKRLRNYTDQLVYIPYFILEEISPGDVEAVEKMRHFCFLPGTIYADKVIVQSENIKQIYVNEFIKEAKKYGLSVDKNQLDKKILGLGSPKIDKVLSTKKEDVIRRK